MSAAFTLRAVRDAVRARDRSAAEVCRDALARIASANPRLNAFNTIVADRAVARAEAIDRDFDRWRAAPLAGVPVAIKDNICTSGVRTTASSRMLERFVPPYDATVVARLENAGAVIVAKTNCDEFAMGSSNETSTFGPVRNPWALDRVPGGTSGGSAAAVAARLTPLALGSDTGGSIRQPSALCGVVGLKPTYGRVSRYGLTASTEPVPDYLAALTGEVRGARLGVPRALLEGIDAEVARALLAALDVLRACGATLVNIELPHAKYAIPAYYLVSTAEASSNLARYDGVRYGFRAAPKARPSTGSGRSELAEGRSANDELRQMYAQTRAQGFGPEVKRRIMLGTYVLSAGYYDAYYLKAQQVRTLILRDYDRAFEQVDAVAMPTSPTPAFRIGERIDDPLQMYLADVFTVSANLAGLPAVSIPCGFTSNHLPIGLQLTGRRFDEATLLRLADAYERQTSWWREAPAL
jgi:aspartyl-tRNA(Asn)/glutamyl-tRNA(Gln) amidotransferase subunit A